MPSKLDYLSKYTSAPDVGGDRKAPKKAKKKKKKKDRNDPGPPRRSRVADHSTSVVDDDDDYFRRGARDSDVSDGSAHPNAYDDDDDGPVVVRDASLHVAGSGEAGGGADSGAPGVWKTVSVYGSRETQKSADERPSSSSPSDHQKEQQDPPQRRRQRHDSSSEEEDGNEGRQRRRRHDSSSDEEEDNGQTRKRRRQRHDSSSEEEDGGPTPDARGSSDGGSDSGSVAGRGRRHRRRYDSDESDAESGGGSRGRPPRRHRGSDSSSSISPGDRRRRCDSDASSASGGGPRMSSGHRAGLQNAGDFARSEQKLAARKHRDALEMVDRHGTGETVYRGKDGRPTTAGADPVAEAANAEEGRRRLNRGRVQQRAEEARASELAALAGSGFARGEDDDRLEAIRRSAIREDDPMAEHARKRQRQNRRGGDGGSAPPKPVYKGPAPRANRFGIPPGYRWDGVDRGNGFEDKILAKRFSAGRKAEKAYRWSSADM